VKKFVILTYLFFMLTQAGISKECYEKDAWATQMTLTTIKNEKLFDVENIADIKTNLLHSKKVGIVPNTKEVIYRQIQSIDIKTSDNKSFSLLTISDYSDEECSMNTPTIILIYPELRVINFGSSYLEESLIWGKYAK
jgi:hypothetical protein